MKTAIQQPYFYPYLGYFKLINSVDKFVFFNDVQYIRRGWINRNRISNKFYLTVPVVKSNQKSLIKDIKINYSKKWHYKHCRTIETRYGKGCLDHPIYLFYKNIPNYVFLVDLLKNSIKNVCQFLNIKTEFVDSEIFNIGENIKNKSRLIAICKKIKADNYFNLSGGKSLYSSDFFNKENIGINFIENDFNNYMSIFDLCLGEKLEKI